MKKLLFILLTFFSIEAFAQSATTTLTANASDSDGTIASYQWSKVSGPSCTIGTPTASSTSVTFTIAGNYTFSCTVTDNQGATATATATVTVTAANKPPIVNIVPSSTTIQLK